MPRTMKPVPLTDVLDIGDICQMSIVLEMTSEVWILCCYCGTVVQ